MRLPCGSGGIGASVPASGTLMAAYLGPGTGEIGSDGCAFGCMSLNVWRCARPKSIEPKKKALKIKAVEECGGEEEDRKPPAGSQACLCWVTVRR